MDYELIKSSRKDIEKLIQYKKNTVYEYAENISKEEQNKINNYTENNVKEELKNYQLITSNNKTIGCLLITQKENKKQLDEIYIEEEYRNKGIGTDILKKILEENKIIYLWVYKQNTKALTLYKKLGFNIIEETKTRYYMKYEKN